MKIWGKTKEFCEGKFLVVRRDGTVPHWPHFVLGARDPAAPIALRAYADAADRAAERNPNIGFDQEYIKSIRELADDFEDYRSKHGMGDPDAPPHRKDSSQVIAAMRGYRANIAVVPDKTNAPKPAPPSEDK
jgi:hypothetical protein